MQILVNIARVWMLRSINKIRYIVVQLYVLRSHLNMVLFFNRFQWT